MCSLNALLRTLFFSRKQAVRWALEWELPLTPCRSSDLTEPLTFCSTHPEASLDKGSRPTSMIVDDDDEAVPGGAPQEYVVSVSASPKCAWQFVSL